MADREIVGNVLYKSVHCDIRVCCMSGGPHWIMYATLLSPSGSPIVCSSIHYCDRNKNEKEALKKQVANEVRDWVSQENLKHA